MTSRPALPPSLLRRALLLAPAALCWPGASAEPGHRPGDALRPRPLVFPRDHGSHNSTRTEWWYMTGRATAAGGRELGFQLTFFRSRVDPALPLRSRLAARQLLFAHAAITDVASGRLLHDERIGRWNGEPPGSGPAPTAFASETDTHVVLGDWFIRREADGRYRSRLPGRELSIDIEAVPQQAWLLQGDAGFSRKGPDPSQASFYVTQPHLAVQGRLTLQGQVLPITGTAWLDHEWSEAILHPEAVGWDWIGMNLDNGDSLTAFQLRRADGSAVWTGGSVRRASDGAHPLGARSARPGEVRFEPRRFWTSPLTRARYPVEWAVSSPAGRHTVVALADAQELDSRASTGTVYWEGLSALRDEAGRTKGHGYLEMTGYAQRLRL
ncbi:lipocalin-like domain-containing protein [Hydrogenophaga sp. R2]|uniref:lipocalin-like domain-containing protein n=1 Tax=Hydrogenophaga sp. R2 TaxID=3132827 RepID=UPI003CF92527